VLLVALIFGWVLGRPHASVFNKVDAALLLTVMPLRLLCATVSTIELNTRLIDTIANLINVHFEHADKKQRGGSKRQNSFNDDIVDMDRREHADERIKFIHLGHAIHFVFVPITALCGIIMVAFLSILPSSIGVTDTPPEQLEIFLKIGWSFSSLVMLLNPITLVFITWRFRGIVYDSVHLATMYLPPDQHKSSQPHSLPPSPSDSPQKSAATAASANGASNNSNSSSGNNYESPADSVPAEVDPIKQLEQLQRRLTTNTVIMSMLSIGNCICYLVGAIVGMQYWYVLITTYLFISLLGTGFSICSGSLVRWYVRK